MRLANMAMAGICAAKGRMRRREIARYREIVWTGLAFFRNIEYTNFIREEHTYEATVYRYSQL